MRAIASKTKTMSLVSKSGTARSSLVGGGTAGAADANSVHNNNYSTHNHGWIGVGKKGANLRGLESSWYVAWSWCRR